MMREYKFRGKRADNGRWVYGFLTHHYVASQDEKGFIYTGKSCIYDPENVTKYDVLNDTIGQYTGIRDKRGRGIYEGDIVLVGAFVKQSVVVYRDACFYTPLKSGKGSLSLSRLGGWQEDAIEVIGNRWDDLWE